LRHGPRNLCLAQVAQPDQIALGISLPVPKTLFEKIKMNGIDGNGARQIEKKFSYNGLMKIILRTFGMKLTKKMMLSLCFGFLASASCAEEGPA
jgi:hypothetical protein